MAFRDSTLTLNAAAQRLSSVYSNPDPSQGDNICLRGVMFQGDGANAGAIFVGSSNLVSSSVYAFRIPAAVAGVPAAPIIIGDFEGGPFRLSDFWVIGTNAEKLHIGTIPF